MFAFKNNALKLKTFLCLGETVNIAFLRSGDKKEDVFRRVCRGEISGVFDGNYTQPSVPKCHLLHHNNPYLGK